MRVPMKRRVLRRAIVGTGGLATLFSGGLAAVAAQEELSGLEEVVVTAQKREQSTQDVGIAMNVFGGEALEKLKVQTTEDLANYVPNLSVRKTKGENYPTVTIRGVGLATGDVNYAMSTSSTALHVDEVYFGSPTMMGLQLFDIERVEVLKGPQGTLYGRNSTAGSINYVTRRPTDSFEGRVSADWSDQHVLTTEGYVSGPLSPAVSSRFAYSYQTGDSYQKDLSGDRWEGPERLSTRTSVLIEPSQDFRVLVSATTGSDDSGIGRSHLRGISDDVWVADGNVLGDYDIDFYGGTVKVDWDIAEQLSLASVTSYHHIRARLPDEADSEAIELQDAVYSDTVEPFSQELRLSGASADLNWVVGGYYFTEEIGSRQSIEYFADFYYPDDLRPGVVYRGSQETDAYAAFGQVEYNFTDKLSMVLGGRYSYEKKQFQVTNLFNNFIADVLGVADQDPATGYFYRNLNEVDANSWDDFSGKIGFNYKASDDTLLYGSVSNGFKSGGYLGSVTITREAVHAPGKPEDLTAYEIGLKSLLLDRKLRVNLAGFYYDYRDMQAESIIFEGIVPFQTLINVEKVTLKGFDFDLTAYPTDRLELALGVGYVDGVHDSFVTGAGDYSGSRILNAPEWSINSMLRYELGEIAGGTVGFIASHDYNGPIDFNFSDRSLGSKAYHMFDARLSYTHQSSGLEMSLWVKNITDEEVLVHAFDRGDGGISELYLQPRRIGLGIAVPF